MVLFPVAGFTEQVTLSVGASPATTKEVLKKIAAVDITPGLEIVGSNGEWPLHGLCWSAPDYKVIFELSKPLCYWTDADFDVSKSYREKSRRYVRSITFDTEKKTYTVKKNPWWRFKK